MLTLLASGWPTLESQIISKVCGSIGTLGDFACVFADCKGDVKLSRSVRHIKDEHFFMCEDFSQAQNSYCRYVIAEHSLLAGRRTVGLCLFLTHMNFT